MNCLSFFLYAVLLFLKNSLFCSATDWTTFGGNLQRTNYNPHETVITKQSGLLNNTKMFVLSWKLALNGFSLAQPLYLKAVNINGAVHDVMFISTENGIFSAIDANAGIVLWERSLGYYQSLNCHYFATKNNWGITGTAVIDPSRRHVYVASNGTVYGLSVHDGSDLPGWPLVKQYDPFLYHNYGALTLLNSTLYVPLASHCDRGHYFGQLIAYNITTRTRINVFVPVPTTPSTAYGAGIWGCAGVSVYSNANGTSIYTATGNVKGSPNENDGYGEHVVKLTPGLTVQAAYTPGVLMVDDDFGATPVIITPTNKCATTFTVTEIKYGDLIITDSNLANPQTIHIYHTISKIYTQDYVLFFLFYSF